MVATRNTILDNSAFRGTIVSQPRSADPVYGRRRQLGVLRRYLLTTPNADRGEDNELFVAIGRPTRAEVSASE
jgi:hypothetical protein